MLVALVGVGSVHAAGSVAGEPADPLQVSQVQTSAGCPTPDAPSQVGSVYQLGTAAHIEWVRDDSTRWDDSYIMVNDIDMGTCVWSRPIAPSFFGAATPFSGSFDGAGYRIDNLKVQVTTASIDDSRLNLAGFIGHLDQGGNLRNLTFRGALVTLDDTNNFDDSILNAKSVSVGVAVAYIDDNGSLGTAMEDVRVENSTVEVTMADVRLPTASSRFSLAGGVAGQVWSDSISNISTSGNVIRHHNFQRTGITESASGGIFGASNGTVNSLTSTDDSVYTHGRYAAAGAIVGELWRGTAAALESVRPDVLAESWSIAYAGGLAGTVFGEGIANARVRDGAILATGAETGIMQAHAGGAIGESSAKYLVNIRSSGTTVQSQGRGFVTAGGIAGSAYDDTGSQLFSDSTVSAVSSGRDAFDAMAGGLVGYLSGVELTSSFATGDVTVFSDDTDGYLAAGGLVGYADAGVGSRGKILDSYATGNANSVATGNITRADAGGLVGGSSAAITRSYSTGIPTASAPNGDDTEGGLAGGLYFGGTASQSYWNTSTSGQVTSAGGTGLTTTQMQDRASFSGWTIIDGWQAQTFTGGLSLPDSPFWGQCTTNQGVPYLLWQHTVSPCSAPLPPSPTPVPPSGARDVVAKPGDRSAVVSWLAPASTGSFPVTNYQVMMNGRDSVCLVPASTDGTQFCVVENLTNGEEYAFTVRALSGAGWGVFSAPSDPVVPRSASILITGAREGRSVVVTGVAPELAGEKVTPWLRFPGPGRYRAGAGVQTVSADGAFTWQRVTGKKTFVYFRAGQIRSDRVIIPAR
jgi:hypothetical protein